MAVGFRHDFTHRANLRDTRYGWLRLTPMYSVHLVEELVTPHVLDPAARVLDPFCGTGTTALVCAERGVPCETTDINPFLIWLTRAKTFDYTARVVNDADELSDQLLDVALTDDDRAWVPPLKNIDRWWDEDALALLSRLWAALRALEVAEPTKWLLTVAFLRTSIRVAKVSFGHQSMSFSSRSDVDERAAIAPEWRDAVRSVLAGARSVVTSPVTALSCDARSLERELSVDTYSLVITSPPYCNRMSYIRELRPYMYWMRFLNDGREAGELDWQAIGGTWGIATSNLNRWSPNTTAEIAFDGFADLVSAVAASSAVLGRYVHKYFIDAFDHLRSVWQVVRSGGEIHYIVGNSKFFDVVVPTEELYAALMRQVGFTDVSITTLRKRSSKKELFEFRVFGRKP